MMLKKIRRTCGSETAIEVLDFLRSLRQTHSELRMVFSGSIGLHHVTTTLGEAGQASAATNDMRVVEVPPLNGEDACGLCQSLFEGEGLSCDDLPGVTRLIASSVDHIPYYIHHVVSTLRDQGGKVTLQSAKDVIQHALIDPVDGWNLEHYRTRLTAYYGEERMPLVLPLLDEIAWAEATISKRELRSRLAAGDTQTAMSSLQRLLHDAPEELDHTLRLLERDHYIRRDTVSGAYCFRFGLIRRWWLQNRDLR